MKRLFYLVDEMESLESISEDLHNEGITDWQFHVLSKDEAGLYTHSLHGTSILDRTDIARYAERGAIAGALFSLAFITTAILTGALTLPTFVWVMLFLFVTAVGAWLAGFGGITTENYRIRKFHDDIEKGYHLVMVDVPKESEGRMKELMTHYHPEAKLQGEDSSYNNPFVEEDGKFHVL